MLAVVYLVFNEGYTATAGDELVRADLCAEAIRLARLLAELMPDEPEVLGLLALLLLTEARRPARTAADGSLVLLADQDRSRWDRALIAEGQALVRACLRRNQPGPYQIQAADQRRAQRRRRPRPTPTGARSSSSTTSCWRSRRRRWWPSTGPSRWPRSTDRRPPSPPSMPLDLAGYHLFHATRADLLRRLGRDDEAVDAYEAALALVTNAAERRFLEERRQSLAVA